MTRLHRIVRSEWTPFAIAVPIGAYFAWAMTTGQTPPPPWLGIPLLIVMTAACIVGKAMDSPRWHR